MSSGMWQALRGRLPWRLPPTNYLGTSTTSRTLPRAPRLDSTAAGKVPTRKQHDAAKALGKRHYDELLEAQGGCCAICKRPPYARRFNVDHDHATLEVRGLLCWLCNYFTNGRGATPELLDAAADYLRNPPARAVLGDQSSG